MVRIYGVQLVSGAIQCIITVHQHKKCQMGYRVDEEFSEEYLDARKEKLYGRVSFWVSMVLSVAAVLGYYWTNPPDSKEVKKMRMFFNEQKMDVSKFLKLSRTEKKKFAAEKKHPFYKKYIEASEVEKEKIRSLAHISYDYTPNQYWFNLVFLWAIFFSTVWFVGLMIQSAIILVRKKDAERKKNDRRSNHLI